MNPNDAGYTDPCTYCTHTDCICEPGPEHDPDEVEVKQLAAAVWHSVACGLLLAADIVPVESRCSRHGADARILIAADDEEEALDVLDLTDSRSIGAFRQWSYQGIVLIEVEPKRYRASGRIQSYDAAMMAGSSHKHATVAQLNNCAMALQGSPPAEDIELVAAQLAALARMVKTCG